ncbi:MAG: hypothetical protein H6850_00535 [Alphaproteobacteria bacterium]|nr:MAG: hypothetical protein H6850_00535 [Alphaproteobacteria bacterium]
MFLSICFLEASETSQSRPTFNLPTMQEFLMNMSMCSEHAAGKDVVIIGGLARTGKSTLVNNLLFEIDYQRKPRRKIEYSGELPVPTSPQITGHTFYPHVYERDGKIFVDIAGMDGFEDFEHRLAGNIGWEMIIKKARSVKLLFVVESDFDAPSSKATFVKFLASVNRLLGCLPITSDKLPNGVKDQMKEFLEEFALQQKIKEDQKDSQSKQQSSAGEKRMSKQGVSGSQKTEDIKSQLSPKLTPTLGFLINSKTSEDSTSSVLEVIRDEFMPEVTKNLVTYLKRKHEGQQFTADDNSKLEDWSGAFYALAYMLQNQQFIKTVNPARTNTPEEASDTRESVLEMIYGTGLKPAVLQPISKETFNFGTYSQDRMLFLQHLDRMSHVYLLLLEARRFGDARKLFVEGDIEITSEKLEKYRKAKENPDTTDVPLDIAALKRELENARDAIRFKLVGLRERETQQRGGRLIKEDSRSYSGSGRSTGMSVFSGAVAAVVGWFSGGLLAPAAAAVASEAANYFSSCAGGPSSYAWEKFSYGYGKWDLSYEPSLVVQSCENGKFDATIVDNGSKYEVIFQGNCRSGVFKAKVSFFQKYPGYDELLVEIRQLDAEVSAIQQKINDLPKQAQSSSTNIAAKIVEGLERRLDRLKNLAETLERLDELHQAQTAQMRSLHEIIEYTGVSDTQQTAREFKALFEELRNKTTPATPAQPSFSDMRITPEGGVVAKAEIALGKVAIEGRLAPFPWIGLEEQIHETMIEEQKAQEGFMKGNVA